MMAGRLFFVRPTSGLCFLFMSSLGVEGWSMRVSTGTAVLAIGVLQKDAWGEWVLPVVCCDRVGWARHSMVTFINEPLDEQ